MHELIQLTEHDYYIEGMSKIGLVRVGDREVVLIDSGNDEEDGKRVLQFLKEKGWVLTAIFNTHSHADHIGGNGLLQKNTGCKIYANGMECSCINNPFFEPISFYGAMPIKELTNRFFLANKSTATPLCKAALPEGFEVVFLPGHTLDMVGYITPDKTAFLGDSVLSEKMLKRHKICYLLDTAKTLQTLENLKQIKAENFVASHAPVVQDIAPLADLNIAAIRTAEQKILKLCQTPQNFETLLQQLFFEYNLRMTAAQYVLIGSTVRSYLTALNEQGKIKYSFKENQMLWETVK